MELNREGRRESKKTTMHYIDSTLIIALTVVVWIILPAESVPKESQLCEHASDLNFLANTSSAKPEILWRLHLKSEALA